MVISMKEALNQFALDEITSQGCQVPGCSHQHEEELYLRSRCHPNAGCSVSYEKGSGILKVTCKECGASIVEIQVAE
jgi:hypothetical protein